MAVSLYTYHMMDGFTYAGMIPNAQPQKGNLKNLVDAIIIPTKDLFRKNYGARVEAEYNAHKTKIPEITINLDNVQAQGYVSCRINF